MNDKDMEELGYWCAGFFVLFAAIVIIAILSAVGWLPGCPTCESPL